MKSIAIRTAILVVVIAAFAAATLLIHGLRRRIRTESARDGSRRARIYREYCRSS